MLQPGGRFYINVPFTYHEHEVPYDFQRPTRYGLQAWLRSAGFKKISVLPSCNSFTGASSFVMTFLYEDLMQRNLIQKYKEIAPFVKNCLDSVNSSLDDYVDSEAIFPVGWIAIAEKEGILKNEAPLQKKI